MKYRFREFIKANPFHCSLFEQEAAPPMGGTPEPPATPGKTTNKHHFDSLKRQLGIDDEPFDTALESDAVQFWKVSDYSRRWGFIVTPPINVMLEKRPDGNYNVTYQLEEKKLMSPKAFYYPYKDGERPIQYEGPVKNQTEVMTEEEVQDRMAVPFASGGVPMGGMGGPAGAPPGLGGPGGGPGAPPMGGM